MEFKTNEGMANGNGRKSQAYARYAVDCASRALPNFTYRYGQYDAPRQVVEALKRYYRFPTEKNLVTLDNLMPKFDEVYGLLKSGYERHVRFGTEDNYLFSAFEALNTINDAVNAVKRNNIPSRRAAAKAIRAAKGAGTHYITSVITDGKTTGRDIDVQELIRGERRIMKAKVGLETLRRAA